MRAWPSRSSAVRVLLAVLALGLPASAEVHTFGKPLRGLPASTLEEVLARPENGRTVRLEGTIDRVCRNKGCWLELKQADRSVHVTFEGYSFFVPRDAAGRRVALEGKVVVKKPDPGHVAHLESEGAASAAAAVTIEASGVEIAEAAESRDR
jgi:hypothetical protein